MKVLTLKRIAENKDTTFGVLLEGDEPICNTVELPWRGNVHDASCIPLGEYICKFPHPHSGYDTWEITGVPDRAGILIHKGNTSAQIRGCVLVGQSFDFVIDRRGVANSAEAFAKLLRWLHDDKEFKLVVAKCF